MPTVNRQGILALLTTWSMLIGCGGRSTGAESMDCPDDHWQIEAVDTVGSVGANSSLALDAAGNPHISYHDATNGALKYARWTGSAWNIETVDSDRKAGWQTSLALDSLGNPHIAYVESPNDLSDYDLRYARKTP